MSPLGNIIKKYNNYDYTVKDNVKHAINFTSDEWADNYIFFTNAGGQISTDSKNHKTTYINIPVNSTTHTTIDNKIAIKIGDIIEADGVVGRVVEINLRSSQLQTRDDVTILKGVTIGKNSVIGNGSIVTKSIPENVIAAGNPARVIRNL